jgi:hypothetical protein
VTGGARCTRPSLAPGTSSTARVPVAIGPEVSGFRTVAAQITQGTRTGRASFRVPVAPPGMTVGYAATGARARFVVAGNTLLSCLPRPLCLVGADNQSRLMVPYLPLPGDPVAPAGLPLTSAASGARLSLPGRVAWAGLFWSGSDGAPAKVSVHAPGGGWTAVSGGGGDQGYADVTGLVRAAGPGDWWVSVPAGSLPVGLGDWAGWSLVVLAADAGAPVADLAAYVGPVTLGSLDFRLGARPAQLGVVAWDGDRCLAGDSLRVGGRAYGNFGDSHADGALESGSWNTLGVDATTYSVTGSDDSVAFSAGDDPLMIGVVVAGTIP